MRCAALPALMGPTLDSREIAVRVRALIGGGDVEHAAERLSVSERTLRISVDELAPRPTLEVLAAIIREYGVDPSWLLFGVYDSATHRAAMEYDGGMRPSDLLKFATSRLLAEQEERRNGQVDSRLEG
jgi:hypothetical protein